MVSRNVKALKADGPATPDELPTTVSRTDKEAGLHKFTLSGGHGTGSPMGGRITPIYYLPTHDREIVIQAFLDANPGLVESKTKRGLHRAIRAQGWSWQDAARNVTEDYYKDTAESKSDHPHSEYEMPDHECDFCGETVPQSKYPQHLRTDCPNTGT
ncbi:hypothetical protein [Haladaptatus caseinilyticus]|uniref:hypothetical protein n=1 Tax=Haladaptatus caseinilyticus TaxID=2993314 RepID=UPI00224B6034|nr:hypothetical protein [Haladaptatus caseinilyticus]